MSTEILNETKSHDGVRPFSGDKGDDNFNINIPASQIFERAELNVLEGRYRQGARLIEQPNVSDTGSGKNVKVHWYFDGGPRKAYIKYTIRAFSCSISDLRPQHKVPGFLPSTSGLHFINFFTNINVNMPFRDINIPVSSGFGGCGGMAFMVRDLFENGYLVPPDTNTPQSGPICDYIRSRLIDSFNLPGGPKNYIDLMDPTLPDGDSTFIFRRRTGRARRIIEQEWPAVKRDIDNGQLSPLGLVLVKSINPPKIFENHQVLAWGYSIMGDHVFIYIYDPNKPYPTSGPDYTTNEADTVIISFKVNDPSQPCLITCPVYPTINSFFHNGYSRKTPAKPQSTVCAKVAFQYDGGKYVCAEGGGGSVVKANRDAIGPWENFTIEKTEASKLRHGDLINIKANNNQYLAAEDRGGGDMNANRATPLNWERFVIIRLNGMGEVQTGEKVFIRTDNDHYLNVIGDTVYARSNTFGPGERFIITILP